MGGAASILSEPFFDSVKAEYEQLISKGVSEDEARITLTDKLKEDVAARIFNKGFSLGQLLDFVNDKCFESQTILETTTTADVVNNVIIPETRDRGCCYADIFPGGPKQPETLMSHWWGNTFLSLVKVS
jgi:hypothetical protein